MFVSIAIQMTVCTKLVQLVKSLTPNQEVLGSVPGLAEG